jgi:carbamoyltransferase
MRRILGISAFYHDSAAALVCDGEIIAAAQEERFSRRKNDERFPTEAAAYCLRQGGLSPAQLDAVVFYDKPIIKFARLLETYLAVAPGGWRTWPQVLPSWLGEKLNLPKTIREELPGLTKQCAILFTAHHQAHAASAFLPSPFSESAILTVDGVGEWATTTIGRGQGNRIELLKELRFPHSLGLLYSTFTAYCGFRVNSGEYKLMGLAPYGEPRFVQCIYDHLVEVKSDGSFWLNMEYFSFLRTFAMANHRFHELFGGPPRPPESAIERRHLDVARSIQVVTEEILLKLARHAKDMTGQKNLCLAGGVALNCVANGRMLREGLFENIWIQPAAGDAGGALGAALAVAVERTLPSNVTDITRKTFRPPDGRDGMRGSLLGPEFSDPEIESVLRKHNAIYEKLPDDEALYARVAAWLKAEKIVGWVQGRMEFGPRALGNRSILGDPRSARMQSFMNLKVKFRESFRPFAPAVLQERAADYFELTGESPYMLFTADVKRELRGVPALIRKNPETPALHQAQPDLVAKVNEVRSTIPAVTHVDFSARVQTVARQDNPRFYRLLEVFERETGCPVLVNTSFNVRGEPIVCSPDDAYRCFMNTEMDYLVIGNYVIDRTAQARHEVRQTFEPVPD